MSRVSWLSAASLCSRRAVSRAVSSPLLTPCAIRSCWRPARLLIGPVASAEGTTNRKAAPAWSQQVPDIESHLSGEESGASNAFASRQVAGTAERSGCPAGSIRLLRTERRKVMDTPKNFHRSSRGVCAALLLGILGSAAASAQTYEVVHAFRNSGQPTGLEWPSQSRLIQGSDASFYGTTYWGGVAGVGTIFRMDTAGNRTTLHSFAYADGANPVAGLLRTSDGVFYGTTTSGGSQK